MANLDGKHRSVSFERLVVRDPESKRDLLGLHGNSGNSDVEPITHHEKQVPLENVMVNFR